MHILSTAAGRLDAALWYLDRLIAARPDDGMLHEDRAAVYGKLGREADRQADLARSWARGRPGTGHSAGRGARQGRPLGRGRETGARSGRTGPLSRELAQASVVTCVRAGDRQGYREACAAFIACHRPGTDGLLEHPGRGFGHRPGGRAGSGRLPGANTLVRKPACRRPAPRALYLHLFASARAAASLSPKTGTAREWAELERLAAELDFLPYRSRASEGGHA